VSSPEHGVPVVRSLNLLCTNEVAEIPLPLIHLPASVADVAMVRNTRPADALLSTVRLGELSGDSTAAFPTHEGKDKTAVGARVRRCSIRLTSTDN